MLVLRARHWIPTLVVAMLLPSVASLAAGLDSNGTFTILNQSLPIGSTNTEYVAQLLTINADGPVEYSSGALPDGLVIDSVTGLITGRPTVTNNTDIAFTADDGVQVAMASINLKINASGGGGNGGSSVDIDALAMGRVGVAYSETITIADGVGPFVFGAAKLPPGLGIDGLTGEISGSPIAGGTYYAEISIDDAGENNRVVTVLPLQVLPAFSDFQFTNVMLNNGEVGTPFCDTWTTSDAVGTVSFSASGLPLGLSVDPATGIVDGTPTEAGTFEVVLNATDDEGTISMNRPMIIVNAGSSLYWVFSGLPAALINVAYDRQPPILVPAANGTTLAYAATGLPDAMVYDALTGEISGTATQVGEYPVVLMVTDSPSGETLSLSVDFLVLPPNGGDANSLASNIWISKHKLKTGSEGSDSWKKPGKRYVSAIYNADRRKESRFDPATDAVSLSIGSTSIDIEPGTFSGGWEKTSYRTAKGETPVESFKHLGMKQQVKWFLKKDTITDTVPGVLRIAVALGDRGFRLDGFLDAEGLFRPALDYRRAAFVVKTGQVRVPGGDKDRAIFALRFADPAFSYESGVTPFRFRLLNDAEVLIDKDFTALVGGTSSIDERTGAAVYSLESVEDADDANRLERFKYTSQNGKMLIELKRMTVPPLAAGAAHLTAELTVGDNVYYTSVTFFEPEPGEYMTNKK